MKKRGCVFVTASDLFEKFPRLWGAFSADNGAFTWGDSNRCLVTIERILTYLDNLPLEERERAEFADFEKTCKRLGDSTYVDLEN